MGRGEKAEREGGKEEGRKGRKTSLVGHAYSKHFGDRGRRIISSRPAWATQSSLQVKADWAHDFV